MIYCYKTADGILVEREFPIGQAPTFVRDNRGKRAHRCYQAEHTRQDADKGQGLPQWPMKSEGMGINPDQIPDAMQQAGARTHRHQYDPRTGAMVFEDRAHRKACMQDLGFHDQDGGFGDA